MTLSIRMRWMYDDIMTMRKSTVNMASVGVAQA